MSSWLSVGSILMANENRPPPPICPVSSDVIGNMTNMTSVMTTSMTTVISNVTGPVELETLRYIFLMRYIRSHIFDKIT